MVNKQATAGFGGPKGLKDGTETHICTFQK
jgi:hypothetical protein